MKRIITILFIAATLFVSCKKNKDDINSNIICTTAKVSYGGDPAADGLGWVLVTDTTTHKFEAADNLSAEYKIDGKIVDICYYRTENDFVCFCVPPYQKLVHLTSIKAH